MEADLKCQDLKIQKEYKMLETKEINSKYVRTCILKGVQGTDNIEYVFDCLTTHLDDTCFVHSPSHTFEFTVKVWKKIGRTIKFSPSQDPEVITEVLERKEIQNTKYIKTYILKDIDEFANIGAYFHRLTHDINKLDFVENPTSPFEFTVKVWKIENSEKKD